MTVDAPAGGTTGQEAGTAALARLRALIRSRELHHATELRDLLDELSDPLDLEAAGTLLRSASAQEQLADLAGVADTRIALLGSSTLDPLPGLVTAAGLRRGLLPETRMAGFDQWQLEILSGAPELSELRPRVVGCLLDDSVVFDGVADPTDVDQLVARCAAFPAELESWLSACRTALDGLVVLATVPLSPLRRQRLASFAARSRLEAAWLRMNADIADLAERSGTVVVSGWHLSTTAGATFAADRMRHVASHAYAPEYLLAYAEELVRVAAADLGRIGKCLVLDLDDTLWGGVVGERGPEGVRLGGSYPGSAYTEVQALARDLSRQGVLLAVCSKNDESVAREAIADHPEMVLRPDSFVTARINWDYKSDNLHAIAEELDIGPDALVFVDDNPAERDLVRTFAPAVRTVALPADPARFASLLAERDDFVVLAVTEEDRQRTARYRAEADRRELVRTSGSLEEYLHSLASRLTVEALTPTNADRVQQLFGRTNQFNLTGIRYGQEEIVRRHGDGDTFFYAARLADRFGEHGLIAALALREQSDGAWCIENMVLSCRVFGRRVEDTILGLVRQDAVRQGAPAVVGHFHATDRNTRFADFYLRLGFRETAPGCFQHDLHDDPAELPPWIEIAHHREVFRVR